MDKTEYQNLSQEELNIELIKASIRGDLEIVKYLLSSLELPLHADLYYKDADGWNILLFSCYSEKQEIIDFLLIDIHMQIDGETLDWIESHYDFILPIIKSRDLHKKLEKDLNTKEIKTKRIKI